MIRTVNIFFLVFTVIFQFSALLHTEPLSETENKIQTETDTVIINSISINSDTGIIPAESIYFKEAFEWAANSRLTLVEDAPPVIDGKAFFISQYQTVIPVSGYRRDLMYRVHFDFLRYRQERVPYNSKLKILIRDIYGRKREVGTADIRYMSSEKKFEVSVPFDLSYPGKFDIIIHEYAGKTGNWGIWDIIVTSKKINEIEIMNMDSPEKIKEIEPKIFK